MVAIGHFSIDPCRVSSNQSAWFRRLGPTEGHRTQTARMSLATPILGRRPANGLLVTRHLVRIAGQRRLESTAAEKAKSAASSATSTASATASRAVRALSAVTSSAGPALGRAAQGAVGALGKIGGRTGRFIGFVERMLDLSARVDHICRVP